jgi:hypothetical protein
VHDDAGRHAVEQPLRRLAVRRLTAGQEEGERPAEAVGERVDLGRLTAARAAMA